MKSKLILNVLAVALAAAFAGSAVAHDPDTLAVPAADRMHDAKDRTDKDHAGKDWSKLSPARFVDKALKSGRKEVESARTAQQRGTDPRVREFAETLERDHSQLNIRLEALNLAGADVSANHGLDQGDRPVGMRAVGDKTHGDAKGKMHMLNDLRGAAFDRHYVSMQVKMHDKSIAMYEAASAQGDNAELKALASDALPTLRSHAELAKSLHASLSAD